MEWNLKNLSNVLNVNFQNGKSVFLNSVQQIPKFSLKNLDSNKYYTLAIIDPDAPIGYWIHYFQYNIRGNNINSGTILFDYMPPSPPQGTGVHRYFCLLYEQNGEIKGIFSNKNRGLKNYIDFMNQFQVRFTLKTMKYFKCSFSDLF